MIIINTPHNPVGKVFTKIELEKIAELVEEFNLIAMADEVVSSAFAILMYLASNQRQQYDTLVYDGKEHVRFANLPGMWDRTVTVESAGSPYSFVSPASHVLTGFCQ
jgi:kynurenine aminotransferase